VSRTNRATQKALLTSGYCAATPGRDAAIVLEIAAGGSASRDGCVTSQSYRRQDVFDQPFWKKGWRP